MPGLEVRGAHMPPGDRDVRVCIRVLETETTKMRTIEIIDNPSTGGPRWIYRIMDGPYEVTLPWLNMLYPLYGACATETTKMSGYKYIIIGKYGEVVFWAKNYDDAYEVYHSSDSYEEMYNVRFIARKEPTNARARARDRRQRK